MDSASTEPCNRCNHRISAESDRAVGKLDQNYLTLARSNQLGGVRLAAGPPSIFSCEEPTHRNTSLVQCMSTKSCHFRQAAPIDHLCAARAQCVLQVRRHRVVERGLQASKRDPPIFRPLNLYELRSTCDVNRPELWSVSRLSTMQQCTTLTVLTRIAVVSKPAHRHSLLDQCYRLKAQ